MRFFARSSEVSRLLCCFALAGTSSAGRCQIYFNDIFNPDVSSGFIRRVNTDGSGLAQLVNTGGGLRGLAVDTAGGKLYWADVNSLLIRRANLDGSGQEDIVHLQGGEEPAFPSALAIDKPDNKLYWGDQVLGTVNRSNLDGTSPEVLFSTPFHRGLAVDDINGKLYWDTSISDLKGEIWRCDLDGSHPQVVVTSNDALFKPNKIALDVVGGKIYWTDYVVDIIRRSNLDGSDIETIYVPPFNRNPQGIALDLAAGLVYWGQDIDIDTANGKIMFANLDGSNAQDFLFGFGHVAELVNIPAKSTERLAPVKETIFLGQAKTGGLASWAEDDRNSRTVCKFFVPTPSSPIIGIDLSFLTTKPDPTGLDFKVKVSSHTPGPLVISLLLIDQTNQQAVSTNVNSVSITDGTTYTGHALPPLGRYVGSGGTIVGRITVRQVGPSTLLLPCTSFELGNMLVTG